MVIKRHLLWGRWSRHTFLCPFHSVQQNFLNILQKTKIRLKNGKKVAWLGTQNGGTLARWGALGFGLDICRHSHANNAKEKPQRRPAISDQRTRRGTLRIQNLCTNAMWARYHRKMPWTHLCVSHWRPRNSPLWGPDHIYPTAREMWQVTVGKRGVHPHWE